MNRYAKAAVALVYAACALVVSTLFPGPAAQALLGVVTLGFLVFIGFGLSAGERRLTLVVFAGGFCLELFASNFLGLYHYQLGQVPFFVIVGHAILFALALELAGTPLGRLCGKAAPWLAMAWCALGLSIFPLFGGRLDIEGAICLPVLLILVWRTEYREFFGLVFFGSAFIELIGTRLDVWTWASSTPFLQIPAGNPPSAIAGMYCLFYWAIISLGSMQRTHWRELLGRQSITERPRLDTL